MKRLLNFLSVLTLLAVVLSPLQAVQAAGVTYVVQKGDTFSDLAWRYGVSIDRLLSANTLTRAASEPLDSKRFRLTPGQIVNIPIELGVIPSLVNPFQYKVQAKDTLGTLSVRFEIAAWAVVKVNGLTDYATIDAGTGAITAFDFTKALPVGKVLLIPAGPHVHRLQANETLGDVATLYGISANYLLKANSLTETEVTAGKDITIPVQYDRPFTPLSSAQPNLEPTTTPALTFADPAGPLTFRWIAQNAEFKPTGAGRAVATFTAEFKGGQAPFKLYVVNWGQFADVRGPFVKTDNGQPWTDLDFDVNARCGETFLLNIEIHSSDGQKSASVREFGPVPCH